MIVYPAIDLRGGRAVQLVGGVPDTERVSLPDPVATAKHWVETGFRALHIVDLDAALGDGSNFEIILELIESAGVPIQVGGGIRGDEIADRLLEAGANRIITGTRAIEDFEWVSALAERWPGRVVIACDIRDGQVLTRGWTESTGLEASTFLARYDELPLAALLVTDVTREGQLEGVDTERFRALVQSTRHPLQAAGGIRDLDDIRALERAGVTGAVAGMSLYTGTLDPEAAARNFTG